MIGRTVSHYKVIDKIGEGGMGTVWKAEDTILQRLVALKTISSHLSQNEEARQRFFREAQAASALNHPNITTVYEFVQDAESHFICMEYVEGKTVRDMVEAGQVSVRRAIDIVLQAAEALVAAHRKEILHRDIKSTNIMVTLDGRVKLMDFGLAYLGERSQLTRTGTLMGTLAYTSPEQIAGRPYDIRSEIWSLGVIFHELLAGQLPFQVTNEAELIFAIINQEPSRLSDLRGDVNELVAGVVARMLEKDPDLRYQTMGELAADLAALKKEGETATTSVVKYLSRAKRIRRQTLITRYLLVTALGSLLVLAGLLILRPGIQSALPHVVIAPFTNQTGDTSLDQLGEDLANRMTEEVNQAGLSSVERVVPWAEVQRAWARLNPDEQATRSVDPNRFARLTGAQIIITGSYLQGESDEELEFRLSLYDKRKDDFHSLETVNQPSGNTTIILETLRTRSLGGLISHLDAEYQYLAGPMRYPTSLEVYRGFKKALQAAEDQAPDTARTNLRDVLSLDSDYIPAIIWLVGFSSGITRDSLLSVLDQNQQRIGDFEQHLLDWFLRDPQQSAEQSLPLIEAVADMALGTIWSREAASRAVNANHLSKAKYYYQNSQPRGLYYGLDYVALLLELGEFREIYKVLRSEWSRIGHEPDGPIFLDVHELYALAYQGRLEKFWNRYREAKSKHQGHEYWMLVFRDIPQAFRNHNKIEDVEELFNEGQTWFNQQESLYRFDPQWDGVWGQFYYLFGRSEQALSRFQTYVENYGTIRETIQIYQRDDDYQPFSQYVFRLEEAVGYLGKAAARVGNTVLVSYADSILAAEDSPLALEQRAGIAAITGNKAEAVRFLETAVQRGLSYPWGRIMPIGLYDYDFASLSDYPSYLEFISPN